MAHDVVNARSAVALDRPAQAFRALRIASAMLSLIGFIIVAGIIVQQMHAPMRSIRLDAVALTAAIVLLVIAPLTWFALNAIRPVLLLPIVVLMLVPVVAYYDYLRRAGGQIGFDLLYGAAIPNIPFAFILWAGWRGHCLSATERAMARPLDPGATYWTVLRFAFGVWPGLVRSRIQAALSGIVIYLSQVMQGLALVIVGAVVLMMPEDIGRWLGNSNVVYATDSGSHAATWLLVSALVVLLMLTSAGLRNLGRITSRQSLERQVSRDRRPPILFLRAFKDDQATLPRGGLIHRFLRGEFGRRRLDHVLVEEFARYGPVVALGRPGQRTLPFGAARIYVDHADWQAKVLELAERAGHIVLVADEGAGVAWEISTMLSETLRAKTIFLATEILRDLRANESLRTALAAVEIPGGARVIGAFADAQGRTVALTVIDASPEAYFVALQTFFRGHRRPAG